MKVAFESPTPPTKLADRPAVSRRPPETQFRNNLKGALLPSRGIAALPRAEVFGKGSGAFEGGGVQHPEGVVREF